MGIVPITTKKDQDTLEETTVDHILEINSGPIQDHHHLTGHTHVAIDIGRHHVTLVITETEAITGV